MLIVCLYLNNCVLKTKQAFIFQVRLYQVPQKPISIPPTSSLPSLRSMHDQSAGERKRKAHVHVGKGQNRPGRSGAWGGGGGWRGRRRWTWRSAADIRGVNITTHHKKHPLYPAHMWTFSGSCKLSGEEPDLGSLRSIRSGSCDCFHRKIQHMHIQYMCYRLLHKAATFGNSLQNLTPVVTIKKRNWRNHVTNMYRLNRASYCWFRKSS